MGSVVYSASPFQAFLWTFVGLGILVVIGAGLISALAGLSMALGAFVAGLLLAETEYCMEIEAEYRPDSSGMTSRSNLTCSVSVGVKAVKSCVPTRSAAQRASASWSIG